MGAIDPYRMTDQLQDEILDAIVARLEARGANRSFQEMLSQYLDTMDIDSASRVLDLGCGTGVAARAIARRPRFSGRVVGVDLSPYLVKKAELFAVEEGLDSRVNFQAGDSRDLETMGAFDAVVAHTLVSHVENPLAVLKRMARIVNPRGLIAIFDGDYASMTFALRDAANTKRFDEKVISAVVTSPYVMRQMPRLIRQAGLELVQYFTNVLTEVGQADFWMSGIESFSRLAPQSGAMTQTEAEQWLAELKQASDEGAFFGSCNYYSYIVRVP